MTAQASYEGGCTCRQVRQPWVVLPPGPPVFAEYYKSSEVWPKESLERRAAVLGP